MFRSFFKDTRGNYAIMTAFAMVPIMGALAIAVDYSEISRQRETTRNALDAAGMAVARSILDGKTDEQAKAYGQDFFKANLGSINPAKAALTISLPSSAVGGGILKLEANLTYDPYFLPTAAMLLGKTSSAVDLDFTVQSSIRLKNTLEVALVLDNSGSMRETGSNTNQKRIDLLKAASKQLVDTLALQAEQMKQIERPVQFALVPFSASVNIAPDKDDEPWMDTLGLSPVHHENFDWSKMTRANMTAADIAQIGNRFAEFSGGVWRKRGADWGESENQPLTRFSLYTDIISESDREAIPNTSRRVCKRYSNSSRSCREYTTEPEYEYTVSQYTSWQGCVEARPAPYNNNDEPATSSKPATLFVPMFAPDEAKHLWRDLNDDGEPDLNDTDYSYGNNWWADWENADAKPRQADMRKYFRTKPYEAPAADNGDGPNSSCTTNPITPLKDVSKADGLKTIKDAIDAMAPTGNTNVPEGTAWGWRVVSSGAPFTEGRLDTEKGNDKVIIVLTDGANTYSPVSDSSKANNRSSYAAYGYTGQQYDNTGVTRMFKDTSSAVSKSTYTNGNYQAAMDEHLQTVCTNAKGPNVRNVEGVGQDNIIVMTVALDLSESKDDEKKAITALTNCASYSRTKIGKKLFWNATGDSLMKVFKEIADELSNLRIVG